MILFLYHTFVACLLCVFISLSLLNPWFDAYIFVSAVEDCIELLLSIPKFFESLVSLSMYYS